MKDPISSADKTIEYQQTISYLHHMYDTRHRIFQFAIAVNAGLLAISFEFAGSTMAKVTMSLMGLAVMTSMALMAHRSDLYRVQVEIYAEELEGMLGFGLVGTTNNRMPSGKDSTIYLFYSYWAMVMLWFFLFFYFVFS